MRISRKLLFAVSCGVIYFILAFTTLADYGISWDETLHFRRGQAYLNYFLTGAYDYSNLAKFSENRRSFYQNDYHNARFFLEEDAGHPPLNDILAALSNYIFFQRLGILDDIISHHLFNILTSSFLIFLVTFWALETFGFFAAVVTFLSLSFYPLFWAESHFNIKDPPESAFFVATIWAFYKSLKNGSAGWLLISTFFFVLAFGTKFNILFLPFVLIPYLLYRYKDYLKVPFSFLRLIPKKYALTLVSSPLIVSIIFIGFWPFLQEDLLTNLPKIFNFYKEVGTGSPYQPSSYFIGGFNTFPVQWIFFTTPPVILILSFIGLVSAWLNRHLYKGVTLLWILGLIVPILRVVFPGMVIYGGIRQIMEFIPMMALLSGLGAWQIIQWYKRWQKNNKQILVQLVLILLFIWPLFVLVKMHPQENVYFNFLIGGLSGAKDKNFPSWGNSFGNAYRGGIDWINQNAEYGAKVALIQGTAANSPQILFRHDLNYQNSNFSGIDRKGEYLMELTFNDTSRDYNYAWEYTEKFLEPVYELKVDGVSILKIWKNDLSHTRKGEKKVELNYSGSKIIKTDGNYLFVGFNQTVEISRIEIAYPLQICKFSENSFIESSIDDIAWSKDKDLLGSLQIYRQKTINMNNLIYYFAGRKAKYLKFAINSTIPCKVEDDNIKVRILL